MLTLISPNKPLPTKATALSTTRLGGVSLRDTTRDFASFNLGFHVGDNEQLVLQNRTSLSKKLESDFKLPLNFCWVNQVHGSDVLRIDSDTYSKDRLNGQTADAIFTNLPNIACCIMTADCLPILISSKSSNEIAVIHAGWKGLHKKIIAKTIQNFSCPAHDLVVWLGPAISQENYEVDNDVARIFADYGDDAVSPSIRIANKYLLSLEKIASYQLKNLNVAQIEHSNMCTYADEKHFFSHRRAMHSGLVSTGRMANIIFINQ